MAKNVQISQKLFMDLVCYFCFDQESRREAITSELKAKLEALVRRELYTKYKTASSPAEKEQARLEYLKKAGIPEEFIY